MQEALGLVVGALAALLVLSASANGERERPLAGHTGVTASKGGWVPTSLGLLGCALILGMVAWSALGIQGSGELARSSMQQQERNRYVAPGPKAVSFFRIRSDGVDAPHVSSLVVREDGKLLGPPHSLHADVAEAGGGRFSHWDSSVVFSTSDNSDPRENGRTYTVDFLLLPSPLAWLLALCMFVGLIGLRATRDGFAEIIAFARYRTRPAVRALCVAVVFLVVAWGFAGFAETRTVKAASIGHLERNAYVVTVPEGSAFVARTGDSAKGRSAAALQVLEDGRALGPDNTPHMTISEAGGGRYSHWHSSVVFSSSDNSDPRANGRGYQLAFRTYPGLFFWLAAFVAIVFLLATPRVPTERLIAASAPPARIAFTVLFVGALALALAHLGLRFLIIDAPVNMQAPGFGSASAPYSDALLWIFGGLQFLLEGSDVAVTPNLYRPTIGILFGSVMAVWNSVEAVPAFFFFSLLVVLAIAGLTTIGTRIAVMLGLWAILCVALPNAPLWHALVNLPMPDLPALLFSLSGLFLVLLFLNRRAGAFALCIGLLLLGIATAIRGALLPAGFLLIVLCCWQRGWKKVGLLAISGLASFLMPFVLDNLLQRHYQTHNNAVVGFYCVVHDATRFWTSACDEMYYRQGVTAGGAIYDYLRFVVSPTGMRFLLSGFIDRVRHDLVSLSHPAFAVALILAALASIRSQIAAASKRHRVLPSRSYWARLANEFWPLGISLVAVITSLWAAMLGLSGLAVALALICMLLSVVRRDFIALACFAVYLSGLVMMTALGAGPIFGINTDRITATYSFALPLGLLAFVIGNETSPPHHSNGFDLRWGRRAAAGGTAAVVFFYFAVWFWPSTWRSTFESDVVGKKAALKVLDDAAVDRSGYYVGGALIYTKRDEFPVGSVRRYERLMNDRAFIESFFEPNALQ